MKRHEHRLLFIATLKIPRQTQATQLNCISIRNFGKMIAIQHNRTLCNLEAAISFLLFLPNRSLQIDSFVSLSHLLHVLSASITIVPDLTIGHGIRSCYGR